MSFSGNSEKDLVINNRPKLKVGKGTKAWKLAELPAARKS